ncbi:MAG: 50S ribosomal protein L4 [Candidatus Omnitrophota bacterium]
MEAITLPVYNIEGKEVDTVKLDASVFDGNVNQAAIYQAVTAFRANQRKGLAATKTRGEVSGGGKKPWKQKGTGRARVGSTRSPLWRHGGVVFGPHPRDFSYVLPAKIRNLALKSGLNSKLKENNLMVLDALKMESTKTKDVVKVFSNLKIDLKKLKENNVLLITDKIDNNLKLASRNVGFLNTGISRQTNVYAVLTCRKLVITKDGLAELTKRLK